MVSADEGIVDYLMRSDLKGYMMIAVAGQAAEFGPDVAPPERLLTPRGIEELAYLEEACVSEVLGYYSTIPSEELFKLDDWDLTLTTGEDPNQLNSVGNEPAHAPVLLVHGNADTSVPGVFITTYVETLCADGLPVQLEWFEGPHRVMYDPASGAADVVLAWIDGRLAGDDPPSVCDAIPPMPPPAG